MRLCRYGDAGREKPGLMDAEDRIRDLSAVVADIAGPALAPAALEKIAATAIDGLPIVQGAPRLGPCVGQVGKFICIGLNYSDHAREAGMEMPIEPVIFMKATSAICGPDDPIVIPRGANKVDWEVELAVVIGTGGVNIPESEAMRHVAGYCVAHDVSERGFQLEQGGQWVKGKSCDSFGPIGPWMVTADAVPDPQALDIWLEVDGHRYQDGNTRTMIFPVPFLVAYVSRFMSLQPGDVISTGTPPGVGLGQKPEPVYLKAGQTVRLGIAGLGVQEQRVVAAE